MKDKNLVVTYRQGVLTSLTAAALIGLGILSHPVMTHAATTTATTVKTTTAETQFSGTVKVSFSGKGQVCLLNGQGAYSQQYVGKGSTWKAYGLKTINGELAYRIGSQKQWLPAKYASVVSSDQTTTKTTQPTAATSETAVNGTAVVTYAGPGFVHLLNYNGTYNEGTYYDRYVGMGTTWHVYAQKLINGALAYRIGNQHQWIAAKYVSFKTATSADQTKATTDTNPNTSSTTTTTTNTNQAASTETKVTGVVATVIYSGKGKVCLLDSNGHYVKQYVGKGSTWKVIAKKTVNGKVYYRIGNESQWLSADYVSIN